LGLVLNLFDKAGEMRDQDKTKAQLIKELKELRKQLAEMGVQPLKREEVSVDYEVEEPWLPIETKLVVSSVVGGVIALVVLAIVVHMFLLGK